MEAFFLLDFVEASIGINQALKDMTLAMAWVLCSSGWKNDGLVWDMDQVKQDLAKDSSNWDPEIEGYEQIP